MFFENLNMISRHPFLKLLIGRQRPDCNRNAEYVLKEQHRQMGQVGQPVGDKVGSS